MLQRNPLVFGNPAMLESKHIDDLTRRLAGNLPKGLQALQEDITRNLRAALEAGLNKLDLVTREEFDVQAAVLARTREKLERLEKQAAELERRLGTGPVPARKTAAPVRGAMPTTVPTAYASGLTRVAAMTRFVMAKGEVGGIRTSVTISSK